MEERKKPEKFPWVIPFTCEGCGDCVNACPTGAIELVCKEKKVPVAWITSPEKCLGCGKCAKACIVGAIQMTSYVDMALERYEKEWPC